MKEYYDNVKSRENVRENLIQIKQELKEESNLRKFKGMMDDGGRLFVDLLKHEDPKVRKNAALILGELEAASFLNELFRAYEEETKLFIKSDYLKAISHMNYEGISDKLKSRLDDLSSQEIAPEDQKHIREEMTVLRSMILQKDRIRKHIFTKTGNRYDIVLITNRTFREVTAEQVRQGKTTLIPAGVKVMGARLKSLLSIRTYRELLFLIHCQSPLIPEPVEAARMLAASDMTDILETAHACPKGERFNAGCQDSFYFRLSIYGRMPLDKRSTFIKRCSFALEQVTEGKLINSPSDYEIEIRLLERKDGTFNPVLKMFTLKDDRFAYRKNTIAASIHPSMAALMATLAKPYLKKDALVLDPFCGVGTMLIERDQAVKTRIMCGLDIYGEAVEKARENTRLSEKEIFYVNCNFFDFKHEFFFDEIFTNMPTRGKRTKEEQDGLYRNFFQKVPAMLRPDGLIILYSNEKGFIRKQIRLNSRLRLLREFCLNEKEEFSLYIIRIQKY